MKDFKENKIIINRVKELFQQLLLILETEGDDEVNYAKKELAQNIEALEGVLSNNVDAAEAQEVLGQIKTSYKSMYPPRGGLSDFFVWREDYEERVKANKQLDDIQSELRKFLTF
jgi:hypothetical protein